LIHFYKRYPSYNEQQGKKKDGESLLM